MTRVYTTGDGKQYSAADGTLLVLGETTPFTLIFDRTQADVDRWQYLHDKGLANMSESERSEWFGEMKGRYAYTDMNRVESVVKNLAERAFDLGYIQVLLITKTDWTRYDCPTKADLDRYFGNVEQLRKRLPTYPDTPETPTTAVRFDYNAANDLEKILTHLNDILTKTSDSQLYAGEIYLGEV